MKTIEKWSSSSQVAQKDLVNHPEKDLKFCPLTDFLVGWLGITCKFSCEEGGHMLIQTETWVVKYWT